MKAYASLWSADLLALGEAIDLVDALVDGGIRRETVPLLAQSGADGVVPGSLVFGEPDPCAALNWIRAQGTKPA
jgi:pentose-5-phosphate-3-epimerase